MNYARPHSCKKVNTFIFFISITIATLVARLMTFSQLYCTLSAVKFAAKYTPVCMLHNYIVNWGQFFSIIKLFCILIDFYLCKS